MSISSAPKSKGFKLSRKSAQANDPYDPYSGIEFSPDKDSDELFECLKRSFPAGKTHKERMKLALMDFIINEQKEKNPRPLNLLASKGASKSLARSPHNDSNPKALSRTIGNISQSRNSQSAPHQKVSTITTVSARPTYATVRKGEQPVKASISHREISSAILSLAAMTDVWRASNGAQLNPRRKKPMTVQERIEYQITRVKGACVSCKKKKRKCKHGLPQENELHIQPLEECPQDTGLEIGNMRHERSQKIAQYAPQPEQHKDDNNDSGVLMREGPILSPRIRKPTPLLCGSPKGSPTKTLAGLLDLGEPQSPRLRSAENDTLLRSSPYQHVHGHYGLNVLNSQIQKYFVANPQHTLHEKEGMTFYDEHPVQFYPTETVFNELYTKGLKSQPPNSPQPSTSAIMEHGRRKLHTSIPNNVNAETWADTRSTMDSPPLSGLSDVRHNHDFNERTNAESDDPEVARVPVTEPPNSSQNCPATQNGVMEPPGQSHLSGIDPPEMEDWKDMFDWDSWGNERNMFYRDSGSNKCITQSIHSGHLRRPRRHAPKDIPPPLLHTFLSAEGVRRCGSAQNWLYKTLNNDKPLGMREPSLPESEPLPDSASRSLASAMIDSLSRGLESTHLERAPSHPRPALLPAQSALQRTNGGGSGENPDSP